MSLRRRVRGLLGIAALWSVGFVLFWLALITVIGFLDPDSIDPGEEGPRWIGLFAALGAMGGAVFGGVLALSERRRSVLQLSLPRMALWGGIAGAAVPLLLGKPLGNLAVFAPLGALLSSGSLLLARRAARADLESGPDTKALNR